MSGITGLDQIQSAAVGSVGDFLVFVDKDSNSVRAEVHRHHAVVGQHVNVEFRSFLFDCRFRFFARLPD